VGLRYTRNHQGYYTLLTCTTSATGTLILGGFHAYKITGGASRALHQEFCKLELLDEIITLQYKNKLPRKMAIANCRNTLIVLFREKKGLTYIPSKIYNAIR